MVAHIFMEVYPLGYPTKKCFSTQMYSFDTEADMLKFKEKVEFLYKNGDLDE